MMTLALLVAAAGLAQGLPVLVQGTSRCPTSTAVAALLPELLPLTNDPRPDIAWIETAGLELSVTLRDPDGNTLVSRRISSAGTCADLANAAAVVIAAWKIERTPELSLLQPGVRLPVPAKPAEAQPPAPPPPASGPATSNRPKVSFEAGVALGTSLSSAGWAGTGRVEVGGRRGRLGVRLSATGDTEHERPIGPGVAAWRRMAIGLGPSVTLLERLVALELHAQFLAGITMVRGKGFDVDSESSGFSPGLGVGLRLRRGGGLARPWIEASGQFWLVPEDMAVSEENQPTTRVQLPRGDLRLVAGLSFVLER